MIYILTNIRAIALATVGGLIVGALYKLLGGAATGAPGLSAPLIVTAVLAEFWLASILAGALILAPPRAGALGLAALRAADAVPPRPRADRRGRRGGVDALSPGALAGSVKRHIASFDRFAMRKRASLRRRAGS